MSRKYGSPLSITSEDSVDRMNRAATKIQAEWRGYRTRQELAAQNLAALTIQSHYRGYKARSGLQWEALLSPVKREAKISPDIYTSPDKAAAVSQASYQGNPVTWNHKATCQLGPVAQTGKVGEAVYIDSDQAATIIQAYYQGYGQKRDLIEDASSILALEYELQKMKAEEAATVIQAYYRGHRVCTHLAKEQHAAAVIQAYYRGYHVRKQFIEKKAAAIKIQSNWRAYCIRRDYSGYNSYAFINQDRYGGPRPSQSSEQLLEFPAEAGYRQEKPQSSVVVLERTPEFPEEEPASFYISGAPVQKELGTVTQKNRNSSTMFISPDEATAVVQTYKSNYKVQGALGAAHRLDSKDQLGKVDKALSMDPEYAATIIQAHYRGFRLRRDLIEDATIIPALKKELDQMEAEKAATIIQANYRGHRVRTHLAMENNAAVIIQAYYRGHRTRRQFVEKKEAVIKIQSNWRAYRIRREHSSQNYSALFSQDPYNRLRSRQSTEQLLDSPSEAEFRKGYNTILKQNSPLLKSSEVVLEGTPELQEDKPAFSYIRSESVLEGLGTASPYTISGHLDSYGAEESLGWITGETVSNKTRLPDMEKHGKPRSELIQNQEPLVGFIRSPGLSDQHHPEFRIRRQKTRKQVKMENDAAVKLQASWRGYQTRREIERMNNSATIIQAAFRGFRTRKEEPWGGSLADYFDIYHNGQHETMHKQVKKTPIPSITDLLNKVSSSQQATGVAKISDKNKDNSNGSYKRPTAKLQYEMSANLYQTFPTSEAAMLTTQPSFENQSKPTMADAYTDSSTALPDTVFTEKEPQLAYYSAPGDRPSYRRTFRTRKQYQENEKAATRIQAAWKGYSLRKQVMKEKKAATTIQAYYRGYKTRQQLLNTDLLDFGDGEDLQTCYEADPGLQLLKNEAEDSVNPCTSSPNQKCTTSLVVYKPVESNSETEAMLENVFAVPPVIKNITIKTVLKGVPVSKSPSIALRVTSPNATVQGYNEATNRGIKGHFTVRSPATLVPPKASVLIKMGVQIKGTDPL